MAVIAALRDGWTALRENPVLLVAGFCFAVVSHLADAGDLVGSPVVGSVAGVVGFLVTPFTIGGLLGMALDALDGSGPSLRRFVQAGREYYVPLLVGIVLFVVAILVVTFATFPLSVVGFVGLLAIGPVSPEVPFWVGVAFMALTVLAVLGTLFFLQFFGAAVVVEGADGVGSLGRSARVVRANLASVLGFSLLWMAAMNVLVPEFLLLEAVAEYGLAGYVPIEEGLLRAAALPVGLAVATLASTYLYTVQTAYYCRLVGRSGTPGGTRPDGATTGSGDRAGESAVRRVDGAEETAGAVGRGNEYTAPT